MIKHLLIICLFSAILLSDTLYHCPNNHTAFIHELSSHFKRAQNIIIASSELNHPALKKIIEKAAHKGTIITLYVNHPYGDLLSMIQYQNINLRETSLRLHHTTIMIDTKIVCIANTKMDKETLDDSKSVVHCTDRVDAIEKQHRILKTLAQKSHPYLE